METEGLPRLLALVATYGYLAFFLLLFLEELGVPLPLPGDVVLLFAGYLVGRGMLRFDLMVMTVVLAAVSGASILYLLSRRYGHPLLARYGRYVRLDARRLAGLQTRFRRIGPAAVLVARVTPGMRIYTSILAGLGRVPYLSFVVALGPAALVWAMSFIFLGSQVGERWEELAALLEHHALRVAAIALLVLLLGALLWWRSRRTHRWRRPQGTFS